LRKRDAIGPGAQHEIAEDHVERAFASVQAGEGSVMVRGRDDAIAK